MEPNAIVEVYPDSDFSEQSLLLKAAGGQKLYVVVWSFLQGLCLLNIAVCLGMVITSYWHLKRLSRRLAVWSVDESLTDGIYSGEKGNQLADGEEEEEEDQGKVSGERGKLARAFRVCMVRLTTGSIDLFMSCVMGTIFLVLAPDMASTPDEILDDREATCLELGPAQIGNLEMFLCTVGLLVIIRLGMAYGDGLIIWRTSKRSTPPEHQALSVRGQLYICIGVIVFIFSLYSCQLARHLSDYVLCLRTLQDISLSAAVFGPLSLAFVVILLTAAVSISLLRFWTRHLVAISTVTVSRSPSSQMGDAPALPVKKSSPNCYAPSPDKPQFNRWHSLVIIWVMVSCIWIPWMLNMGAVPTLSARPGVVHWTLVLLHVQTAFSVFVANLISLGLIRAN